MSAKFTRRVRRYGAVPAMLVRRPAALRDTIRWVRSLIGDQRTEPIRSRRPWMNYGAQRWLERTVRPGWRVLEYGAGGSTLWLQDRGCQTVTIEHDGEWANLVRRHTTREATLLDRPDDDGYPLPPEGEFDLIIVDGRRRVDCALAAWERLRPGGWLVLDNSGRPAYEEIFAALGPGRTLSGVVPHRTYADQTTVWQR